MNQTWENGKKPNLELNFDLFGPNMTPPPQKKKCGFYLLVFRHWSPSYHPMQFSGKLTYQTSENGKNHNIGPNFGLFDPNLGPQNFFYLPTGC